MTIAMTASCVLVLAGFLTSTSIAAIKGGYDFRVMIRLIWEDDFPLKWWNVGLSIFERMDSKSSSSQKLLRYLSFLVRGFHEISHSYDNTCRLEFPNDFTDVIQGRMIVCVFGTICGEVGLDDGDCAMVC